MTLNRLCDGNQRAALLFPKVKAAPRKNGTYVRGCRCCAMTDILNWVAPAATIIAAMMTAANLGARITGWGFAIFLVGSLAWTAIGATTGQGSLIYANAFLILVNAVGVWRWLGRQAQYEDGSADATRRSARANVPTLFSFGDLIGSDVLDRNGNAIGAVVDVMGDSKAKDIAYLVVREGGVGGVGERLHAVSVSALEFSDGKIRAGFDGDELTGLHDLKPGEWPATLAEIST